ncbi:MAG TPA: putative glycolipid-binding domain-containing protein, partial [Candidatus Binataceae bacterium]|nr:putative glycolipid-binding domain-containing protein [Candidatus Binataceae bacterium]
QPQLRGAIDVDIAVTPFTNILPIRRLGLSEGQRAEILVVYFQLPQLTVTTDRQRYTRLGNRVYRYESVDSDFTRDIEVDERGLVVTYPDLFRRTL